MAIKKSLLNSGNQKCLFNPGDQNCLFNPGSQKSLLNPGDQKCLFNPGDQKHVLNPGKIKKGLLNPGDQKCLLNPGDQKKPTQSWQSKKACSILVIKKKKAYSILVTKKSLLNPRQVTEIFFVSVLIGCKTCPRESGNNKKKLNDFKFGTSIGRSPSEGEASTAVKGLMISNLALLLVVF